MLHSDYRYKNRVHSFTNTMVRKFRRGGSAGNRLPSDVEASSAASSAINRSLSSAAQGKKIKKRAYSPEVPPTMYSTPDLIRKLWRKFCEFIDEDKRLTGDECKELLVMFTGWRETKRENMFKSDSDEATSGSSSGGTASESSSGGTASESSSGGTASESSSGGTASESSSGGTASESSSGGTASESSSSLTEDSADECPSDDSNGEVPEEEVQPPNLVVAEPCAVLIDHEKAEDNDSVKTSSSAESFKHNLRILDEVKCLVDKADQAEKYVLNFDDRELIKTEFISFCESVINGEAEHNFLAEKLVTMFPGKFDPFELYRLQPKLQKLTYN